MLGSLDDQKRIALEAAAFRRLVSHLKKRTDVQNIDLINLSGFCRNCLANWLKEAADEQKMLLSRDESRHYVYGMAYEDWKALHQSEATQDQKEAFKEAFKNHG